MRIPINIGTALFNYPLELPPFGQVWHKFGKYLSRVSDIELFFTVKNATMECRSCRRAQPHAQIRDLSRRYTARQSLDHSR